jgi:hypothetical protein
MSDMTDLAFFEKEPTVELVVENPTSRRGLSACDRAAGDVAITVATGRRSRADFSPRSQSKD